MTQWHLRSKRGPTGKLMNRGRKKKRRDRGTKFLETRIGKRISKPHKSRGSFVKIMLLSEEQASLADPNTKKVFPSKILSVKENPANPHYVRRNIITKGAIIETEAGLARVTSRPGQDGIIQAVLLKEK